MIQVKNVEFDERFDSGDAVIFPINDTLGIFYLWGMVLNGNLLPGELRFIRDEQGERRCILPKQHISVPEKMQGKYRFPYEREEEALVRLLNGFPIPQQFISIDNILALLRGEDTLKYHSSNNKLLERLLKTFPDSRFSEVGSTNVGLSSATSDIDIYVFYDYERVMSGLRENLEEFGLKINEDVFMHEVSRHSNEYGFTNEKSKKICYRKLSGLEFQSRRVTFFDARQNPVFERLFNPNCLEQITVDGRVIDSSFSGHHTVFYDIENRDRYSLVLLRRKFQKGKRYILEEGDFVKASGRLVHRDPSLIIVDDLTLTL
ncbi:hypothetical protein GF386_00955 [Candidatus Pacearchaeota archaeon]|nr:hypothetical protein [Candidatus Pacearchaeota archaeon]MBD3282804.1 hypothetical protein [Candidatus Pacearchaeota archaeon]